ncbi:transcription factor Tfb4-domain-containing protein [Gorgonomyces haynaldii]|nr:transcription factor Tfb4-domain-containing protein [Gorgonomyces haynaldii]
MLQFVVLDLQTHLESVISHSLLYAHLYLSQNSFNKLYFVSKQIIKPQSFEGKPGNISGQFYDLDQSLKSSVCVNGSLPQSISNALAYRNKHEPQMKTRILIISGSKDKPQDYMPMMNCIFAAQRQEIVIDCLRLSETDSTHLQQACYITRGIYETCQPNALVHVLLYTFLASQDLRQQLVLRQNENIDFTTNCFCHKKRIDLGYVCHVCLAIYCESVDICRICSSVFTKHP